MLLLKMHHRMGVRNLPHYRKVLKKCMLMLFANIWNNGGYTSRSFPWGEYRVYWVFIKFSDLSLHTTLEFIVIASKLNSYFLPQKTIAVKIRTMRVILLGYHYKDRACYASLFLQLRNIHKNRHVSTRKNSYRYKTMLNFIQVL